MRVAMKEAVRRKIIPLLKPHLLVLIVVGFL
jgi:hypothetical protein